MQLQRLISGVSGVFLLVTVCQADSGKELKDELSRINYSIGYQIGGDFKNQGWKLKSDLLLQGIRDAEAGTTPLLSSEQMKATLVAVKNKLTSDQLTDSKKKDSAFLVENAATKGVVVLPSGVQYSVIRDGKGKMPTLKDSVTIRYQVNRVDNRAITVNLADSQPKTYQMTKALPGLQEVLKLMKEGSIWRVVMPPGRTVGSKGEALENVGVLIYTLELVSVKSEKGGETTK